MLLIECVKDGKLKALTSCISCDRVKELSSGLTKEDSYVKCWTGKNALVKRHAKRPEEL